jgi:hypothetical protein
VHPPIRSETVEGICARAIRGRHSIAMPPSVPQVFRQSRLPRLSFASAFLNFPFYTSMIRKEIPTLRYYRGSRKRCDERQKSCAFEQLKLRKVILAAPSEETPLGQCFANHYDESLFALESVGDYFLAKEEQ